MINVICKLCKHQWETEPVDRRRCVKCGRIERNYTEEYQEHICIYKINHAARRGIGGKLNGAGAL